MNQLKLIHITGDSRYGGAGRIILRLGQVAKAEGWQVDVLSTDVVFRRAILQHGLGVVDLNVIRRETHPLWDLAGLARLCNFLRREQYDIVHTHTTKAGFVGRLAARLANVPVIVHTVHGFAFHEQSPLYTRLFFSALERMALRWCDQLVSVSEFHRRWALDLGICNPSQMVAIPNGIAKLPEAEVTRSELRRRLAVREDDLMILSMSRLAADKGLNCLIEAAAALKQHKLRFQIVIAGDGPVRGRLEQQALNRGVADRVLFLGFRQDISDLLAASDLVVLPSLREGLSITLLEAMAAGKPIVATSIGSHRELARQADMARLVPPGDSRALSEAILQVASNPALMVRLGASARALFENHYTEDRMLNGYKKLYFDLLTQKCPAEAYAMGLVPMCQRGVHQD